jgi:hypothetical protein
MKSHPNHPAASARKLSTDELASLGKVKPDSIRSAYCRDGEWMGLRPVKLPNRRLLWDATEAAKILGYDQ